MTQVTAGFGGCVAVAPRLFLRELVDVLDRVDQHEAYEPQEHYTLNLADETTLTPEELAARHGRVSPTPDPPGGDAAGAGAPPKRLDG